MILINLTFCNGFVSTLFTKRTFYICFLFLDNTEKKVIAAFAIEFSFFVFCFEIFRYKIFKFSEFSFMEFLIFIKEISIKYVFGFSTSRNPLKTIVIPFCHTKKVQDPPHNLHTYYNH